MKKGLFLMVATIMSSMAFAVDTKVRIDITGVIEPGSSTDYVYLIQADRYSAARDSSDTDKMMNGEKKVSVYAKSPLGDLSTMQTNDLVGTFIGFYANANLNYTMTFSWLEGETLSMKDWAKDTIFAMTASMSYPFTVEKASTKYDNRFQIVASFKPDEGDLEICHIADELQVKNNPYSTNIVVKNEIGEKVVDMIPQLTPQIISLKDLPKGRYTVEFNDGKEVFVISVKPDVKPAK